MTRTLAMTGATGFVGRTVLWQAVDAGWNVRALARSPQPPRPGVEWICGALDRPEALDTLVAGADAVLHIAGVTNAPDRDTFARGNVAGTEAIIAAAERAGATRFVQVSSLSAREAQLSDYGWSKAEAEARVRESALDWTMVRPPAIYGPGDVDHLDLFKAARFGVLPLPPHGRMSTIHVGDLARLLLTLAASRNSVGETLEVDDGVPGGWTHADYGRAIGAAMGRQIMPLPVPAFVVRAGARLDRMLRGAKARLTPDRAAYFCHPDWVIDPGHRPSPHLWQPQIPTPEGLAATARWYRDAGWL